jgi:hypothetical protein
MKPPVTPEAIAAWAKETRERLAGDTIETVTKALYAEANTCTPFEVPVDKIEALLRLWIRDGVHEDVERFYPETAARIRALVEKARKQ